MIDGDTVLAIIPARAGSKGIINKNLKKFCGLPFIGHSINQKVMTLTIALMK